MAQSIAEKIAAAIREDGEVVVKVRSITNSKPDAPSYVEWRRNQRVYGGFVEVFTDVDKAADWAWINHDYFGEDTRIDAW